jgi:hypothetical protein
VELWKWWRYCGQASCHVSCDQSWVEWQIGVTGGIGVKIGEGVIPGGVDLSATVEGRVANKFEQGITQGTGWDLPAEQNTIVVYTLMWRELWQRAYVDVRLADQTIERIDLRYRTGIQSEIVGKQKQSCGGEQPPTQQTTQAQPQPTVAPPAAIAITIVSLKYDETDGIQFAQGQTQFVAVYLRKVQGGDSLEEAIKSIKQQAANARATIQEGKSISIQLRQAYLVWCPTADCVYPTNTAFPLEGFRQDYLKVAVIEVGENRMVQCPSNCWAVSVR